MRAGFYRVSSVARACYLFLASFRKGLVPLWPCVIGCELAIPEAEIAKALLELEGEGLCHFEPDVPLFYLPEFKVQRKGLGKLPAGKALDMALAALKRVEDQARLESSEREPLIINKLIINTARAEEEKIKKLINTSSSYATKNAEQQEIASAPVSSSPVSSSPEALEIDGSGKVNQQTGPDPSSSPNITGQVAACPESDQSTGQGVVTFLPPGMERLSSMILGVASSSRPLPDEEAPYMRNGRPVIFLNCRGEEETISESAVAFWKETFPEMDLDRELAGIAVWLRSNFASDVKGGPMPGRLNMEKYLANCIKKGKPVAKNPGKKRSRGNCPPDEKLAEIFTRANKISDKPQARIA